MNSTQWETLTEFVKYLGRSGKCKVEETPKGWFISYIDRDSEMLLKERMKNKRIKLDVVEEEKHEREIQKQIEKAEQFKTPWEAEENERKAVKKELSLERGMKIRLSLGRGSAAKAERVESCRHTFLHQFYLVILRAKNFLLLVLSTCMPDDGQDVKPCCTPMQYCFQM
ncbi:hypothetical protein V6N13_121940 [Hibiscus sabdariffa]|uniref:DNA/RNA-binding protein Kin17 WH-like domain-containing protein n=2 Tax=Hibiscus sabdariffa TaxID=183260 RepID=A0ABR2NE74_9ROSI